jgi:hypothetical protein
MEFHGEKHGRRLVATDSGERERHAYGEEKMMLEESL